MLLLSGFATVSQITVNYHVATEFCYT